MILQFRFFELTGKIEIRGRGSASRTAFCNSSISQACPVRRQEKSAYLFCFRRTLKGAFCRLQGEKIKICRYKMRRSLLSCGTKRYSSVSLSFSVEILDFTNVHVCPHIRGEHKQIRTVCFYYTPHNLLLWGHYIWYSNQSPFTFLPETSQNVVISLLLLCGVKFIANTTHTDNII